MTKQLIPEDVLGKAKKILFIAHLALGDFTYLQNYFRAFSQHYPHIKIDLWVDEVRRTSDASKWPQLKKYVLYDWVAACPFFNKIYRENYSPDLLKSSLKEAQAENYPIVISLATLRPHRYARLAREISPTGFVAGMRKKEGALSIIRCSHYKNLNASLDIYSLSQNDERHISDIYATWFSSLFGIRVTPDQRFPFVEIPEKWKSYAEKAFESWGIGSKGKQVVFVNPYAKTEKRCWPLEHVGLLINEMSKQAQWNNAYFIINAMPHNVPDVESMRINHQLERTFTFSAEENFFQLPAILRQCDLVISVETAVMHLANAVHVPVIALMRQKNPEWVPIDKANSKVITAKHRRDWVKEISVEEVMEAL